MRQFMMLAGLLFVAIMAWRIGEKLSPDAVSLGLGVMLGVLAGLPAAILILVSRRRSEPAAYDQAQHQGMRGERGMIQSYGGAYPAQGYGQNMLPQMPVIVLAGNGMATPTGYGQPQHAQYPALPSPAETIDARQFKVIGEKEEWLGEW